MTDLSHTTEPTADEIALRTILRELDHDGYDFTTISPDSHARVLEGREGAKAENLRDVFGWSLPFARELLDPAVFAALEDANALVQKNDHWRSLLRVSSLGGNLFLHSSYPTVENDAVFFGPDSYRFARFVEAALQDGGEVAHLLDLGSGCGPGGVVAVGQVDAARVTMFDMNPTALRLARVNAAAAGIAVEIVEGDSLDQLDADDLDLILANPPFMVDDSGRNYRDGGDRLGIGATLDWATKATHRLRPGGRMLLYSGSPIIGGEDALLAGLAEIADGADCTLRYNEIDPDIFGEELTEPVYRDAGVDRIAAVGAVLTKA